jgi:hypothetical protein
MFLHLIKLENINIIDAWEKKYHRKFIEFSFSFLFFYKKMENYLVLVYQFWRNFRLKFKLELV